MTTLTEFHADHGAEFSERAGRKIVREYHRPERTHRAVRNGVGVIEMPYGVIAVEGADRVDYVDNVVTNRVPSHDGAGCYSFLLDPQGRIETDLTIYNAGERLLLFTPPGRAGPTADGWETFIQDVEITVANEEYVVFGVHGPSATEKVASVLTGPATPEAAYEFVRGSMGDIGVTVARTDAPTGEEGFNVITRASEAATVFDTLLTHGMNAVPFGTRVWEALTLEAGTPLFETELADRIPNVTGVRSAVDFEKGCFVGQEVVSKVQNRGRPSQRLIGLRPNGLPDPGAAVFAGDAAVGEVTRATESPALDSAVAFAYVEYGVDGEALSVRVDGQEGPAASAELPFVTGSQRSMRIPSYPTAD